MEMICKKCNQSVEGEDMGDTPAYLSFYCECGESWGEDIGGMLMDEARNKYKYRGINT
jgi:hypothetical protein